MIKLSDILDRCVPRKKLKRENSRYVYPEWYTADIIRDIKNKARFHKTFKKQSWIAIILNFQSTEVVLKDQ